MRAGFYWWLLWLGRKASKTYDVDRNPKLVKGDSPTSVLSMGVGRVI